MTKSIITGLLLTLSFAQGQIEVQKEASPLFAWQFNENTLNGKNVDALQGSHDAKIDKSADAENNAVTLKGSNSFRAKTITSEKLPNKQFTVESWVYIDKPTRWGGICGYFQDNGDFERGWLLGYMDKKFSFQLCTGTKLICIKSFNEFKLKTWYHVTASYDGTEMKLYINGKLVNFEEINGKVNYPEKGSFTIGAYHDSNEFFGLSGKVSSVAVYPQDIGDQKVADLYKSTRSDSGPIPVATGLK